MTVSVKLTLWPDTDGLDDEFTALVVDFRTVTVVVALALAVHD